MVGYSSPNKRAKQNQLTTNKSKKMYILLINTKSLEQRLLTRNNKIIIQNMMCLLQLAQLIFNKKFYNYVRLCVVRFILFALILIDLIYNNKENKHFVL